MDHLTIVLASACALLVVALIIALWVLLRPRVAIQLAPRRDLTLPPRPTHVKCNTKHFIFTRINPETGNREHADVWRHPYCENLPNDMLTDAVQGDNFLAGRQGQGWQHAETRGEMHMVKF